MIENTHLRIERWSGGLSSRTRRERSGVEPRNERRAITPINLELRLHAEMALGVSMYASRVQQGICTHASMIGMRYCSIYVATELCSLGIKAILLSLHRRRLETWTCSKSEVALFHILQRPFAVDLPAGALNALPNLCPSLAFLCFPQPIYILKLFLSSAY